MLQNFLGPDKWLAGVVTQRLGSLTYIVNCKWNDMSTLC